MIVYRSDDLPAYLAVARPTDGREVLVVIGGGLDRAQVRDLSRMLLVEPERRELLRGW